MTIPALDPIAPIPAQGWDIRPYGRILPFVMAWGRTHADTLEDLRLYVRRTFEFLNTENTEVNASIAAIVANLIATVNTKIAEVQSSIETQSENVDTAIANLTDYVNAQVALIIEDAVQVQDPVVAGIMGDDASATRDVMDGLYIGPLAKSGTGPAATQTFVNLADFGALGDNTGDQGPAIQSAIDAAGSGGVVRIPNGVYRIETPITVPAWTTLEGNTPSWGAGATSPVELRFAITGATVGITVGAYATLRNLKLRGPGSGIGTTTAIYSNGSVNLDHVSITAFNLGVNLNNAYYAEIAHVEFLRNGTGIQFTGCYNVNLISPRFYCGSSDADAPGRAITNAARALNIFGGSIEGYFVGISVANNQVLNLFGTYFETKVDANATAIAADARDNVSISAQGCMVFLNGHARWLTTSGSTDTSVWSHGNHFVCVDASVQTPTAYVLSADQSIHLSGDNFSEVVKSGVQYVAGITLPAAGAHIITPIGTTVGPLVYNGIRGISAFATQTVAADGAVTLDAKRGDQIVTLNANATSSAITNAPTIAQTMSVTFVQDATGGRTYVWPTNCRFAGGVAPNDTTANRRTTVTFRYETATGRWHEVSRAVAVTN